MLYACTVRVASSPVSPIVENDRGDWGRGYCKSIVYKSHWATYNVYIENKHYSYYFLKLLVSSAKLY